MSACQNATAPDSSVPSDRGDPGVQIITTEEDFAQAYCRTSSIAWPRFRLAAIAHTNQVLDVRVTRDESHLRIILQTRSSCGARMGGTLHLLLPAVDAELVVVLKPGPPADCPEGYGY